MLPTTLPSMLFRTCQIYSKMGAFKMHRTKCTAVIISVLAPEIHLAICVAYGLFLFKVNTRNFCKFFFFK